MKVFTRGASCGFYIPFRTASVSNGWVRKGEKISCSCKTIFYHISFEDPFLQCSENFDNSVSSSVAKFLKCGSLWRLNRFRVIYKYKKTLSCKIFFKGQKLCHNYFNSIVQNDIISPLLESKKKSTPKINVAQERTCWLETPEFDSLCVFWIEFY